MVLQLKASISKEKTQKHEQWSFYQLIARVSAKFRSKVGYHVPFRSWVPGSASMPNSDINEAKWWICEEVRRYLSIFRIEIKLWGVNAEDAIHAWKVCYWLLLFNCSSFKGGMYCTKESSSILLFFLLLFRFRILPVCCGTSDEYCLPPSGLFTMLSSFYSIKQILCWWGSNWTDKCSFYWNWILRVCL